MATAALIPVEEYLRTFWRPDRDYVDGEALERNLGEKDHAYVQSRLVIWFGTHEFEWNVVVLTEQRVQITPDRYRIPDVCIVSAEAPDEQILQHPPLVVVEVLSPEDRLTVVRERLDDYVSVGIENIWVIDPYKRKAWTYSSPAGYTALISATFTVPDSEIHLPLASAFAGLRQPRS